MVERDSEKPELYFINSEPIFIKSDFESAEVMEEDNGNYGILFKLKPLSFTKWETLLNSKVHYIGFVSNNRIKNLIKLKGENSSSELYISCYTNSREESDLLKDKY